MRMRNVKLILPLVCGLFMSAAFGGGEQSRGAQYETLLTTGEYVLAYYDGKVDVLSFNGTVLSTMEVIEGKHTTSTTWICRCHPRSKQIVTTTINTKHIDSDLRNHDIIVAAKKRRHPEQ